MSTRRLLTIVAVLGVVILAGCAGGISPTEADVASATDTDDQSPTVSATTAEKTPAGEVSVHQLNVGQGSSTLVIGPEGETILIDTGDWRDDGEDVIAYLEAQGVTPLQQRRSTARTSVSNAVRPSAAPGTE